MMEFLAKNNCLGDRVYRAGADGPLVLGGFLPVPVVLAAEAERLASSASLASGGAGTEGVGSAALVAVDDLDRVQGLNVIGWLQPELGPDNRLRTTNGVPTQLWDKWTEVLRWAEGQGAGEGQKMGTDADLGGSGRTAPEAVRRAALEVAALVSPRGSGGRASG